MLDYTISHRVTVAYVEAVEPRRSGLARNPTHRHRRVPFFEKSTQAHEQGSKATGIKRKLFDWAMM